jgi:cardiolipin synthase
MIHAKTSVADGIWFRVGSSNLNSASLLGNWEIDMGIVDRDLARQMEGLYLADLASAVEIVLPGKGPRLGAVPAAEPVQPRSTPLDGPPGLQERLDHWRADRGGSTGWRLADLVRAGSAFGEAIAGHRVLGREDRRVLGTVSMALLVVAAFAGFFPRAIGFAFAGAVGWLGVVTGVRAFAQYQRARREAGTDGTTAGGDDEEN